MVMDKLLNLMGFADEQEEIYEETSEPEEKRRKGQIVALHNRESVKVKVVEPLCFEEAQKIADDLKNRKAVVINLEQAELDLAIRVIDFVGGTAYAIGGSMQKIGKGIILVVPPNIDIDGSLAEVNQIEQKDKEVFSWVSNFPKKENSR
ncbi:cell division inhibitor SepF [Desulfonispora thiosulfatigenes DSM 11270]|uniref:Cell division protein SepF n=1 Tax=Desulfonispora thiosulfatigenes DSM 11270 TaxID=656914 RepID=A0A1W1VLQ7_DESTI|nr:cell division inhibitor SepF [Desulfonispora thiosulfatigenes DSM 11270]